MDFAVSHVTSRFRITLPKIVREKLGARKNDKIVFLVKDGNVYVTKRSATRRS